MKSRLTAAGRFDAGWTAEPDRPILICMSVLMFVAVVTNFSLIAHPAVLDAGGQANACRYRTDMRHVVARVARFVRDGPGMDAATANRRFADIARNMADVEARDGRPRGAETVHALLFTAMSDVEGAISLWHKYHDPDVANARVYHARRSMREAVMRLAHVPCRSQASMRVPKFCAGGQEPRSYTYDPITHRSPRRPDRSRSRCPV